VIVEAQRAEGVSTIRGLLIDTDVNFPCRDLFAKCGFVREEECWVLSANLAVKMPEHVTIG
jgi:hypothetical protein